MTKTDDRWKAKPFLEEKPWSLIRSIGLSQRAAKVTLATWAVLVTVALVLHRPFSWGYLGVGFMGFLMLRYVLQRLQGVPAEFTGPSEAITEDWPFQIRLAVDVTALAFLVWASAVLAVGFAVMNALLP